MKYRSTGTRQGHKIFVRKRETAFDAPLGQTQSTFGTFEDHIEMKTWQYAAFQKEQFSKKRKEKRKRRIVLVLSLIIAITFIAFLPLILRYIIDSTVA